jgi:general stress protein CsbA
VYPHIDIITIQPLVALIFGILILMLPRLLNYFIAIYLIFIGVVGLWPHLFTNIAR